MKLYFMKQSALDYMKANIGTLYKKYFQFDSPDWIYELFDYEPFEVFAEVPDFELASLSLSPGEIDLENCKILYTKLNMLSESQASDERVWAGLCNKNFYGYLRARWEYARRHLKKSADDSQAIMRRYFYGHGGRSGMFRNTLARCWWTGRLTYTEKYPNHWELLEAIGSEDIISKISDIFYSNTYSGNKDIVEGFCEGLKFFRDHGMYVSNRNHIRPTAQYLNALGGGLLLDMFTADEVRTIVIEHMGKLMNGGEEALAEDADDTDEDAIDPDSVEEVNDADEVSVDFGEYLDRLEQTPELDIDSVLGELTQVEYGCKVHICKTPDNYFYVLPMPMAGGSMNQLQKWLMGRTIGEAMEYKGAYYTIVDIRR